MVMPYDVGLVTVAGAYLIGLSLAIAVIDWRYLIIPNGLNAASGLGGLAFSAAVGPAALFPSLLGGGLGFAMLLAFKSIHERAAGREGLGYGDVKYMAGAGLWVGWQGLAPTMLVASLTALCFIAVRGVVCGRIDPLQKLPFGPFLCFGTLSVWAAQRANLDLWDWVL